MDSQLLQQGLSALDSGNKAEARRIFTAAVKQAPNDAEAWLALSRSLDSKEQQIDCLKQALRVNPDHDEAHGALDKLTQIPSSVIPDQRTNEANPAPEAAAILSMDSAKQEPVTDPLPERKPSMNQIPVAPRKRETFRNLVLTIIALVLMIQVGISGYGLYLNIQREADRQLIIDELETQVSQQVINTSALSDQLLDDYNENVYHNSQVESAIQQQVVGNDYIVAYLKLIADQNIQLLVALAKLR